MSTLLTLTDFPQVNLTKIPNNLVICLQFSPLTILSNDISLKFIPMKIENISGTNFRSFGQEGVTFSFKDNVNIIVGKNNVGKSNLIRMVETVRSCLAEDQKNIVTNDDFHNGNNNAAMKIELHAMLDNTDIQILMNEFKVPLKWQYDFLHIFGDQLTIEVSNSTTSRWEPSLLRIGRMRILNKSQGSVFGKTPSGINNRNKISIQWKSAFVDRAETMHQGLSSIFDDYVSQPGSQDEILDFKINVYDAIKKLLDKRIKSFAQFTQIRHDNIAESAIADRSRTALFSFLASLRNGTINERQRFAKIQDCFSKLFPNWNLDVRILPYGVQPQIVIVNNEKYDASQEAVGAAILNCIHLITYLIDTEGYVLFIDEPELRLHPHAQRLMSDLITKSSNNNQIICITHSSIFMNMDGIEKIISMQ